jgi:hypothetical protein
MPNRGSGPKAATGPKSDAGATDSWAFDSADG